MAAWPKRCGLCSRFCRPAKASPYRWKSAEPHAVSPGDRLVVGLVRGFHGLRGTVRVESLTDRSQERFSVGRLLFVEGGDAPLTIVEAQPDAQGWRLRFAEVADRTAAETLRDVYLEAIVAPGEGLPRGEFYWHEVIGASVTDTDGTALGNVADVY